MSAPGFCRTLRDFEGDVDSNYKLCCNATYEGTNGGGLQSCPSIKTHETDNGALTKLYEKGSAIVCQSQPYEGNAGPENPYFDWIKKEELNEGEKIQLCGILRQFTNRSAEDRTYSTQIQFASPSSTKTPVIVSHYSVAAGKEIQIGNETDNAKKECSDALNTRKTNLAQVIRAEIYYDLCDQENIPGDSYFCDGDGDGEQSMADVLADVKGELRETNDVVISKCSQFTNADLKDVMQTMINLSTSDDSTLNQAAANVCGSLPWMYWRSFNNGRNDIQSSLFTAVECEEPKGADESLWELRLPQNSSTLNVKIDVKKAQDQWNSRCTGSTVSRCIARCNNTKVDSYLNSLRAVVDTQFFKDLSFEETDAKFTDICRNLRMTPKDVNRTNGIIKTGVLGSEFKSLIEGKYDIDDKSVSGSKFATEPSTNPQMSLKDDSMKNGPGLQRTSLLRKLYNAHLEYTDIICEFNNPEDASAAPLPVFSQNPFMVMYSMGKSLGDNTVGLWDNTVGLYPLGAFRDKDECEAWPPS